MFFQQNTGLTRTRSHASLVPPSNSGGNAPGVCFPSHIPRPEVCSSALRIFRQNCSGSFSCQSSRRAGELGASKWRSRRGSWSAVVSSKTTNTYFVSGLALERARYKQFMQWASRTSSDVTQTTTELLDLKARTKLSTCKTRNGIG